MRKPSLARFILLLLLFFNGVPVFAGPYADDMGKCLVRSSSEADRTALMKWLFSLLALNPQVESMATISAEQREGINRDAGSLFQRLLTESCRLETQQAVRFEGPIVIQQAFQVFGQASMAQLVAAPRVSEAMKGFAKYLDEEKIKSLMAGEPLKQ